jgi:hypothetical protein
MSQMPKFITHAIVAVSVSLLPGLSAAQPTTLLGTPVDPPEQITRFINNYNGGDCFFVTPVRVTEGNAILEGYGSSVAPFENFGYEFKRQNGFDASITAHQVTLAQCAAVNFLLRMRNQHGIAPRLDLVANVQRGGRVDFSVVTGTVADFGNRNVDLLMVADDGIVYNLTGRLKAAGDTKSFSVAMQRRVDREPAQPQLVVAVVGNKPLEVLKDIAQLGTADQVFAQLLAESLQSGQSLNVSAKYFTLQK